jgi:hypothetical protein
VLQLSVVPGQRSNLPVVTVETCDGNLGKVDDVLGLIQRLHADAFSHQSFTTPDPSLRPANRIGMQSTPRDTLKELDS